MTANRDDVRRGWVGAVSQVGAALNLVQQRSNFAASALFVVRPSGGSLYFGIDAAYQLPPDGRTTDLRQFRVTSIQIHIVKR
jgi:hypothetical protein